MKIYTQKENTCHNCYLKLTGLQTEHFFPVFINTLPKTSSKSLPSPGKSIIPSRNEEDNCIQAGLEKSVIRSHFLEGVSFSRKPDGAEKKVPGVTRGAIISLLCANASERVLTEFCLSCILISKAACRGLLIAWGLDRFPRAWGENWPPGIKEGWSLCKINTHKAAERAVWSPQLWGDALSQFSD